MSLGLMYRCSISFCIVINRCLCKKINRRFVICLKQMNVSSTCIDACSFYLDMDSIMDRPECVNDFDKLMKCAADGSGK